MRGSGAEVLASDCLLRLVCRLEIDGDTAAGGPLERDHACAKAQEAEASDNSCAYRKYHHLAHYVLLGRAEEFCTEPRGWRSFAMAS